VFGKVKAALKSPTGNAPVKKRFSIGIFGVLAAGDEGIFLSGNIQVLFTETRHSYGNTIGIFARLYDVVGRVGVGRSFHPGRRV